MVVRRWRQRAGPGLLALGVLGLFGPGASGAEEVAWTPPECPAATVRPPAGRVTEPAQAASAWYRVEPRLDGGGAQVAQRVLLPGGAGRPARSIDLASESFAAGPFGGQVLTGSDDGRGSRLRLVDLAAGCARTLATERDVIRRATIDPAGAAIYEFRVDRRTRADLGVWRRPLDGSPAKGVLAPMPPDARFGRTFSTELTWSIGADQLVVQSCGAAACRTRVFDPRTGATTLVDDPGLGELVGVADGRIVAYEVCRGLPCPIVSVDLASRSRTVLAEAAGLAVLADDGTGARIVHEDGYAGPDDLRVVDLLGVERGRSELANGTRLVPAAARGLAGVGLPPGWVAAMSEDGTWPVTGPRLLRPSGPTSADVFEEVLP